MNIFDIKYNFRDKVDEPLYNHSDNYFYYCYTIEVPKHVKLEFIPNKMLVVSFCIEKEKHNIYCFYIMALMSVIAVKSNMSPKDFKQMHIYEFIMKPEDSYIFGKAKKFTTIEQVIKQQYKEFKLIGGISTISTIYFMKLISNKLIYHQYFLAADIMANTEIMDVVKYNSTGYFNNKFLKAPYSSATYCASRKKLHGKCFIEEGVIVQTVNNMLGRLELKCLVIDGNILIIGIKSIKHNMMGCFSVDLKRNSINFNSSSTSIPDYIKDELVRHIDDIKEFVKKCYIEANILLNIYVHIKNKELKFIEKYKLDKELFFSDLTIRKLNVLRENADKYDDYIALLNTPLHDHRNKFKNSKIIERFMRIDIMLPDGQNYKKITLLEIEPFASGHGVIDNNKVCIDMPDNMHLIEQTSTALVLMFLLAQKMPKLLKQVKDFSIVRR